MLLPVLMKIRSCLMLTVTDPLCYLCITLERRTKQAAELYEVSSPLIYSVDFNIVSPQRILTKPRAFSREFL